MLDAYIRNSKPEWIPYLKTTKTGLCFDNQAKEKLIDIFPSFSALKAKLLKFLNLFKIHLGRHHPIHLDNAG
jgi:hypothetical protein